MYWILGLIAALVIFILVVLGLKLWANSAKDNWLKLCTVSRVIVITWANFIESVLQSKFC